MLEIVEPPPLDKTYYNYEAKLLSFTKNESYKMIDTSNIQEDKIHELINNAHEQHSVAFDKDLTHG